MAAQPYQSQIPQPNMQRKQSDLERNMPVLDTPMKMPGSYPSPSSPSGAKGNQGKHVSVSPTHQKRIVFDYGGKATAGHVTAKPTTNRDKAS